MNDYLNTANRYNIDGTLWLRETLAKYPSIFKSYNIKGYRPGRDAFRTVFSF